MPSFDIVSQVNSMEIENAVNQAQKELANRFDFKGSTAQIVLEKNEIKLSAEDQFKLKALNEIVTSKLAKRQISLKSVEKKEPDVSPLGHARQVIVIKRGQGAGFSGIENALFYLDHTRMLYGDGQAKVAELVQAVKQL